jgi:hypothetical protein
MEIVQRLFTNLVNPFLAVLFILAILYFFYGVLMYLIRGDDPEKRAQGARHILYGTIGLVIMVSAWGLIAFVQSTVRGGL